MLFPIKNAKVYEIVIEQIKDIVKRGELKCGDKLPSERDLCDQLKVSRTSVREALRALEMIGLIESRHGEGNFIKENVENSLHEPLSILFLLLGRNSEDVLELRKIIEPESAALAAKNISNEQLTELKEIMVQVNCCLDVETLLSLDKKFHYLILQASGNHLISTIMFSLSSLIETYIQDLIDDEVNKNSIISQHREIFEALESRDSNAAFIAIRKHLESSKLNKK